MHVHLYQFPKSYFLFVSCRVNFGLYNENDVPNTFELEKDNIDLYSNNEFIRHLTFKIQQLDIDISEDGHMGPIENAEDITTVDNVKSSIESCGDGNNKRCQNDVEKSEDNDAMSEMVVSTSTLLGEDIEERSSGTSDHEDFTCECDLSDVETEGMRDRLHTLTAENVGQLEYEKEAENEKEAGSIKIAPEPEKTSVLAQSIKNGKPEN